MKFDMRPKRRWGREVWLISLALPVLLKATVVLTAFGVDEPPNGWTGLIVLWLAACLFYPGLAWLLTRIGKDDGVSIEQGALMVKTSWKASVPLDIVSDAYLVQDDDWEPGKYGNWKRRELQPEWRVAPNVNVSFREPVRLGNLPFRWYTSLQLRVDRPADFVSALKDVMADR